MVPRSSIKRVLWESFVVRSDISFIPSVTGSVEGNVRRKITEGKDKEVCDKDATPNCK